MIRKIGEYEDMGDGTLDERFKKTIDAMKRGVEWIYQGVIKYDNLLGIPDLLKKMSEGSYIPVDIKSGMGMEGDELKTNNKAMSYLKHGESLGIHKGYKCGIRNEWQIIPSIRVSDALFIRRNNIFPRLIENKVGAYTTDTMHRVSMKAGVNQHALIASYYNSLSLAFAEIAGRSHGGGVLELMPNEAEEIFLPYKEEYADLLNRRLNRKKQ